MANAIERPLAALAVFAVLALSACSNENDDSINSNNNAGEAGETDPGSGGTGSSSASGGRGGASAGGSSGSPAASGGTGTVNGTGGDVASGGTGTVNGSGGSGSSKATGGTGNTGSSGGSNAVGGTGGSGSTGGSKATGGTGNESGVGGNTGGSGSAAGMGGTDPGTGGGPAGAGGSGSSGGTEATGGTGNTGSSGGSNAVGGTGGSTGGTSSTGGSAGTGDPDPFCGDGNVDDDEDCDDGNDGSGDGCDSDCAYEPFSYGAPVRDMTFPTTDFDFTGRAGAFGPTDIYVPVKRPEQLPQELGGYSSAIAYKGASGWEYQLYESYVYLNEVSGPSAMDVYAVGMSYANYFYKGVIARRVNRGAWQEVKRFGLTYPEVTSVHCVSETNCFAAVQFSQDINTTWPTVFRGSGTDWTEMSVPTLNNGTGRRIVCTDADNCFLVGEKPGEPNGFGFLLHWDGATWSNIALPGDVTMLRDVAVSGNEVTVVGQSNDGGVKKGVCLVYEGPTLRSRYDNLESESNEAVWSSWESAALIAGADTNDQGQYSGGARLIGRSLSLFDAEAAIDTTAMAVTSIVSIVPGTVLVTAYGHESRKIRAYTVSYQ